MEYSDELESLVDSGYKPSIALFSIEKPAIPTGYLYHFSTSSGLLYEVRFARKQDNILGMVVNFSVLSDEFEHEYAMTNRGEVYSVIATVIEIIRMFHCEHHLTDSYEFHGEFKDNEEKETASIRTRLYLRYAQKILSKSWKAQLTGNKVVLRKM